LTSNAISGLLADTVRRRGLLGNMLLTRGYINNFLFRPNGVKD